ncbi:MAG: hypothetical protein R3F14_43085 [Polyangiaceae bacterium]
MRSRRSTILGSLLLAALAHGCTGQGTSEDLSGPDPLPTFDSASRGSSVVLDAERLTAWVADADNRAIHHVDLRIA